MYTHINIFKEDFSNAISGVSYYNIVTVTFFLRVFVVQRVSDIFGYIKAIESFYRGAASAYNDDNACQQNDYIIYVYK